VAGEQNVLRSRKKQALTAAYFLVWAGVAAGAVGYYVQQRSRQQAEFAAQSEAADRRTSIWAERERIFPILSKAVKEGSAADFASVLERSGLRPTPSVPSTSNSAVTYEDAISALKNAASAGQLGIVEFWFSHGWPTKRGANLIATECLTYASTSENPEVVHFLLGQHADVNARLGGGPTALLYAAMRSTDAEAKIALMLIDAGANVNVRTDYDSEYEEKKPSPGKGAAGVTASFALNPALQRPGWTPLMYAAKSGRTDVIRALLNHRADASIRDSHGLTAADIAKKYKHPDVYRLLEKATLQK
jgi:hypothetical protein